VIVEIGKGDAVAFLKMPKAAGRSDVLKAGSRVVPKHFIGDQTAKVGCARAEVKVEPTVVVQVAEVGAHGQKNVVQVHLVGYVTKSAVVVIAIETRGNSLGRQTHLVSHEFVEGGMSGADIR